MTSQHLVTPSPELRRLWAQQAQRIDLYDPVAWMDHVATQAANWGADQELEACCEWLHWQNLATHADLIPSLRAARRPKPPSLAEQALDAQRRMWDGGSSHADWELIRAALERLQELENNG